MWDLISILADKIISDLSLIAFQLDIRPRQTPKNWNYRCPHLTVCRRWWNTGINWKRDVPFSIFRYFGFKFRGKVNKTSVHFSLAFSVALIFHSQDLKVNFLSVFLRYSFYLSSKTLVPSERMFTNWCLPLFSLSMCFQFLWYCKEKFHFEHSWQ